MRYLIVDADRALSPMAQEQVLQLQAAAEALLRLPLLQLKVLPPLGRRAPKLKVMLISDASRLARPSSPPSPGSAG